MVATTAILIDQLKGNLEMIQLTNEKGLNLSPAEVRMRATVLRGWTRRLFELVEQIHQVEEQGHKLKTHTSIVHEDFIPVDSIDVVNQNDIFQPQLEQQLQRHPNTKEKRGAIRLVIDRNEEMNNVEYSLNELNNLIRDFALLVELQNDMLDSIEWNVTSAQEAVVQGQKELKIASKYKTSIRKKKAFILTAVFAGLGLGIFALFRKVACIP